MSHIQEMTNEELIKEFKIMIKRNAHYSDASYRDKLEAELFERLEKKTEVNIVS